jgi:hypothetical protein
MLAFIIHKGEEVVITPTVTTKRQFTKYTLRKEIMFIREDVIVDPRTAYGQNNLDAITDGELGEYAKKGYYGFYNKEITKDWIILCKENKMEIG